MFRESDSLALACAVDSLIMVSRVRTVTGRHFPLCLFSSSLKPAYKPVI